MRGALVLAVVVTAAACATASGEVSGGDPREPVDAGIPPEELIDAGTGATWTDLYRDLFGPTGLASCAGTGVCHGAVGQAGEVATHFVCSDQKTCRQTMLDAGLVRPKDSAAPEKSVLETTLRHRAPSGIVIGLMPKQPPFVFPRAAMDRISTWIAAGTPDN